MSDNITFTVTGATETIAALRELSGNLPNLYMRRAMRSAATSLAQLIALVAPKRTGILAANIIPRTSGAGGVMRGRVVVATVGKRGDPRNAFYWRFLEKGWHDRAGGEHREEFIAPVVEGRAQATAQMVIDTVRQAIDDAAAKARSATPVTKTVTAE